MQAVASKEKAPGARIRVRILATTLVMIASIAGMLVLGNFGMDTLSSLRAFVGAESLYSKGQQGGAFDLLRYANSGDQETYDEFLESMRRPLADKRARLALEKPTPDLKTAFKAFEEGGNHPEDIGGMIDVFLTFRNIVQVDKAIRIWTRADEWVTDLMALGEEFHGIIQSEGVSPLKTGPLAARLVHLSHELNDIEEEFSDTLGEVSRWARGLFVKLIFGFAAISVGGCLLGLWFVRKLISDMQENAKELEAQNWLKSGQAALAEKMREAEDIAGLSSNVIRFICENLGAGVGAMYVCEDGAAADLKMMAGYAFEKRKRLNNHIGPGEGLVGQAALEKKQIALADCPDDYIRINSALGAAPPRSIIAYPLVQNDVVNGVIEIGSFREFSERDLEFLHLAAETVAIAIGVAQARHKEAVLLEKTQQQAEELTAQQEELRASNEELEQHARGLEESEQKLQAQQEELRVINEELTEQAQNLEEQKDEIEKKNLELDATRRTAEEKARELELTGKYKSEFLANMSHELRTPLNSILLLSKLLLENKDGNLTGKQAEFAQTIHSSGSDLLTLINDVLDLSKVEAGKMELNVAGFTLQRFAEKMQRTYEKIADGKGLEFSIRIQPDIPPTIQTDFQRLEQIVKNLISNAIKFTAQGAITLSIGRPAKGADLLQSGLVPDQAIAFAVSDTGIGIDKNVQQFIFEAFQQADGSTNRKYGGTGLGLSISRELAKHLGGEIQLESETGKGSTFTLYIPGRAAATGAVFAKESEGEKGGEQPPEITLEPDDAAEDQNAQMDAIRDDRRGLSPDDKSILIIEDDPAFLKTLRDLAREKGFKALIAVDGETGLHMADYYQPSAIILDVGLPGIDGWNVMTRLKAASGTRHIPIHFISGNEKARDAIKMGAVGYLLKPVSLEKLNQLFATIEELVDTRVKKLMVVGSDKTESACVKQLLKDDDIAIDIVDAGSDALLRLKENTYHCIILGLTLSDMTGMELLLQIRKDETISHIPVIVYTEKELTNDERVYLDSQSERIITKDSKSLERLFDETTLFLHRVEANLPEKKRRILEMVHDKKSILKDKKILIVDDDMRNVFALTSILEEKGVRVFVAKNGREGVSRVLENPDLNLVLMDIMMPEMNGYEAMKKIREMDDFKRLPIIALTAKAMRGDRAKCIEAGASDYLSKPVDNDKLLSMLRVWLYR